MPVPAPTEWALNILQPQDDHGKRRAALLAAAFKVMAEVGFEGLRTRAVADLAGVNISTLHYYFPTKQNLVEGLATFISAKFITLHGPAPAPSGLPALDGLRQEFSDVGYYLAHHPDLILAMQEFTIRGKRDAEVLKIVNQMGGHWQSGIERMLQSGLADGTFRSEFALPEVLTFLMAVLSGTVNLTPDRIAAVQKQTEQYLLSDKAQRQLSKKSGAKKK